VKRLACLHGGAHTERSAFKRPVSAATLAAKIYLLDLPQEDLTAYDGLIVPEGLNQGRLDAAAPQIRAFLEDGGAVFLFGDQPTPWLPGLSWHFAVAGQPDPDALRVATPQHAFHSAFTVHDFYHQHGWFAPPAGAEPLMTKPDGKVVLYVDAVSTGGRMMVSSLDLMHHVDGFFSNPVSRRFYDRFLPWVAEVYL